MECSDKTDVAASPETSAVKYSVVVPFYNEADVIEEVYSRIVGAMEQVARPFEMVFVNDGSKDDSLSRLERIAQADPRVTVIDLRRNFGQTAAIQAGLDAACGEVLITMDGDLQHDPWEIPLFIKKIDEGHDIVSGWRVRRGDNAISRRLPSRMANWLLAKVSGVPLHDFGTTFKAYRREVLEGVRLYGDMHRFIPAICARLGADIVELPIKNVRRKSGRSNYGIGRTFRVALDIITVRFVTTYLTRPLHFFGKWGLATGAAGAGVLIYLVARKIVDNDFSIMRIHGPLMTMGLMLLFIGLLFLAMGVMGEMMMRIYFEASGARTYAVRKTIRAGKTQAGHCPPYFRPISRDQQ